MDLARVANRDKLSLRGPSAAFQNTTDCPSLSNASLGHAYRFFGVELGAEIKMAMMIVPCFMVIPLCLRWALTV